MYSLASLPLLYVFAFAPSSELVGFILFFIINVIACFLDMVLDFITVFSQFQNVGGTGLTGLSRVMITLRWIIVGLFPAVNFKHSLFNIRIRSSEECLSAINGLLFTNYTSSGSWMAVGDSGLGLFFILFCVQAVFWWIVLVLIENRGKINVGCRRCCKCDKDLEQFSNKEPSQLTPIELASPSTHLNDINDSLSVGSSSWDDSVSSHPSPHLSTSRLFSSSISIKMSEVNVDSSCKSIHLHPPQSSSFVISSSDSKSPKPKHAAMASSPLSTTSTSTSPNNPALVFSVRSLIRILLYIDVDRLAGANGAGKTTTFRMLINDLRPTTGEIIINGRDINKSVRLSLSLSPPLHFSTSPPPRNETWRSASVHSSTGSFPICRSKKQSRSSPGEERVRLSLSLTQLCL